MKRRLPLFALVLWAVALPGLPAWAQTVYRCGNVYSQTPCAGGVALDTSDTRTPTQKAQADAAAIQTAKSADKMQKDRLALEKAQARKPSQALAKTAVGKGGQPADSTKSSTGKKKKDPDYFTAAAPNPKKGTTASKESGNKEAVAGSDKPVKP